MLDPLKYDNAIHPNTAFVANLLVQTAAAYKWCLGFFQNAREEIQAGRSTEAECLSRFTETVLAKLPRRGTFKVRPETVDWPALFNFIAEITTPQDATPDEPSAKPRASPTAPGSPEYSWEDLQPIFDKWMHIADIPQVIDLCRQISDSTSDTFLELIRGNIESGNLSTNTNESADRGEKLGSAVGSTMRASFMIGLEYGDQRRGHRLTPEEIESVAKQAYPLLRAAVNPTVELATGLAVLLETPEGKPSYPHIEATANRLAKTILRDSLGCFRAGLQYRTPA